jgi:hypothetical protein
MEFKTFKSIGLDGKDTAAVFEVVLTFFMVNFP